MPVPTTLIVEQHADRVRAIELDRRPLQPTVWLTAAVEALQDFRAAD